jgi:hypothetical protein
MSEYKPKVGVTVTVAGADGVWRVQSLSRASDGGVWVEDPGDPGRPALRVLPSMLTLVPTLPPEPALWTFGFLDGTPYQRQPEGWWDPTRGRLREWADIAADFEPAVTRKQVIDEVVAFVRDWPDDPMGRNFTARLAGYIEREFGGRR